MLLGLRPWAWSTVAVVHVLSPHRPQRQRQQEQEQIDNKNKNKTTKNNNKKQKNTLTSLPMVIHALGFVSLDIVAVVHVLPPHVFPDVGRFIVEVGDALFQLGIAARWRHQYRDTPKQRAATTPTKKKRKIRNLTVTSHTKKG